MTLRIYIGFFVVVFFFNTHIAKIALLISVAASIYQLYITELQLALWFLQNGQQSEARKSEHEFLIEC